MISSVQPPPRPINPFTPNPLHVFLSLYLSVTLSAVSLSPRYVSRARRSYTYYIYPIRNIYTYIYIYRRCTSLLIMEFHISYPTSTTPPWQPHHRPSSASVARASPPIVTLFSAAANVYTSVRPPRSFRSPSKPHPRNDCKLVHIYIYRLFPIAPVSRRIYVYSQHLCPLRNNIYIHIINIQVPDGN